GEARRFYAGELEKRRGRDHFRLRIGRRCEEELSERLEVAEAVHSHHSPAEVKGRMRQSDLRPESHTKLRLFFLCSRALRVARECVYSSYDELLFPHERDVRRLSILCACLTWRGEADPLVLSFSFESFRPTARIWRWVFCFMAGRALQPVLCSSLQGANTAN